MDTFVAFEGIDPDKYRKRVESAATELRLMAKRGDNIIAMLQFIRDCHQGGGLDAVAFTNAAFGAGITAVKTVMWWHGFRDGDGLSDEEVRKDLLPVLEEYLARSHLDTPVDLGVWKIVVSPIPTAPEE